MKQLTTTLLLLLLIFTACKKDTSTSRTLKEGSWIFELLISKTDAALTIPFNVTVSDNGGFVISNAEEKIDVTNITYKEDSVFIVMPVFGSEFKGKIADETITGTYHNYNKEDYYIPFRAKHGVKERFALVPAKTNFEGTFQAAFSPNTEDEYAAIADLEDYEDGVKGTFLTETGDYRYLQGQVVGEELRLSTFDGAHAFLFTAKRKVNDTLQIDGMFYSGNHFEEPWTAIADLLPELKDAYTLTYLKPGEKGFNFSFPNIAGDMISPQDAVYKNKVVIAQIFGTWCPNCMDETRFYTELYEKQHEHGLEIISLDFEPKTDRAYFVERANRFKKDLNVPWEVVLAGLSDKREAAKALPMLNAIISYPTSVFIDRQGAVRKIHTGFTGPGTGGSYTQLTTEIENLVEQLLSE